MATTIRPEISRKNRYWISRNRYYELKHFCLQYRDWMKNYYALSDSIRSSMDTVKTGYTGTVPKPTEVYAEARLYFKERLEMVENAARIACGDVFEGMWGFMIESVTENISYEKMKARYDIPCCKEVWYEAYRRFFWYLDKARK